MAKNITWRNVQNTVTGNPAAALSAANSSFAIAGQGADRMHKQALARQEKEADDLTDSALSSIFADGKATPEELAGVDPGANFGDILSEYQTGRKNDADIARADAARIRDEEDLRVSKIENSEERLAAKAALEQTRAETAAQESRNAAQRSQHQTNVFQREIASRKETDNINTQWDDHIAAEYAPVQDEIISDIQDAKNTITDPDKLQLAINRINEDGARALDETERREAMAWTAAYGIKNRGYDRDAAAKATPFQIATDLKATQAEREKTRLDADLEVQKKEESDLAGLLAGGKKKASSIGLGAGGEPEILSPENAGQNTITPAAAIASVKSLAGDKWFVDEDLAQRYQTKITAIVNAVGGNKELFNRLMSDNKVSYNRDTAFLGLVGGEDDVKNLPSIVSAEKYYRDMVAKLNGSYVGKKSATVNSGTEALFANGP